MFNYQAAQPAPHMQTALPAPHIQATLPAPPRVAPNPPGPAPAQTEETCANQSTRSGEIRAARSARRSEPAHNPVRGQRGKRREGGGGRTPGAANYHDREVEVLLDIVEELLPVGENAGPLLASGSGNGLLPNHLLHGVTAHWR